MSAATPFPWPKAWPKSQSQAHSNESAEAELALFQNAPFGVAQCSRQGTIVAMNPAMEQLCGESLPDLRFLADLVGPENRDRSEQLLDEMFSGVRDSFQLETEFSTNGNPACLNEALGNTNSLKWSVWRAHSSGANPDCVLVAAEDTTKLRHSERQLRQADKLETVGRLTSGIAHDFNSLLTAVLLYSDLLLEGLGPDDRLRKYAHEIRDAGNQATGLVRQLLDLAKRKALAPQLLSLNETIEAMRSLLLRLIGDNIELCFYLDPNLSRVKMDPAQAQQVLLNLVLNARDALPRGGQIRIETSNCKIQITESIPGSSQASALPCALFVVADNGCGMDAETKKHLFEAFFTTKSASEGTGLGLATVYDIVTNSGGLLHVDSQPGQGTRMTVLLPLAPEDAVSSSHDFSERQQEGELAVTKEDPTP